jgi:hypothetical protein
MDRFGARDTSFDFAQDERDGLGIGYAMRPFALTRSQPLRPFVLSLSKHMVRRRARRHLPIPASIAAVA